MVRCRPCACGVTTGPRKSGRGDEACELWLIVIIIGLLAGDEIFQWTV